MNKSVILQKKETAVEISLINLLADIEIRNVIYWDLLNMLKLEGRHRNYLREMGLLNNFIENNLYRIVPRNYINRRIIAHNLSKKYNFYN